MNNKEIESSGISMTEAKDVVKKLEQAVDEPTNLQKEQEEKEKKLISLVNNGINKMYDEIIKKEDLDVSDKTAELIKYHIVMSGSKTFVLSDHGKKKVESELISKMRSMTKKTFPKGIKKSCKHCYGYGIESFMADPNMVIIPIICRCLVKGNDEKKNKLELLAEIFEEKNEKE